MRRPAREVCALSNFCLRALHRLDSGRRARHAALGAAPPWRRLLRRAQRRGRSRSSPVGLRPGRAGFQASPGFLGGCTGLQVQPSLPAGRAKTQEFLPVSQCMRQFGEEELRRSCTIDRRPSTLASRVHRSSSWVKLFEAESTTVVLPSHRERGAAIATREWFYYVYVIISGKIFTFGKAQHFPLNVPFKWFLPGVYSRKSQT